MPGEWPKGAKEAGHELLVRLLESLLAQVAGAIGAGLTLVEEVGEARSVAAVGVALDLDRDSWGEGGAARQALKTGQPVVNDIDPPEAGACGVVVTANEEDAERGLVVTLYLNRSAEDDDVRRLDRLQPLLTSAVAVVEYCSGEEERAEQMVQMVQYRRVIEQAKGLVMAVTGTDAGSAFATLARASQHFNVRLRNLSVALVEMVGQAPAEGPTDPAAVVTPAERDRASAQRMWAALTAGVRGTAGPARGPDEPTGGHAGDSR